MQTFKTIVTTYLILIFSFIGCGGHVNETFDTSESLQNSESNAISISTQKGFPIMPKGPYSDPSTYNAATLINPDGSSFHIYGTGNVLTEGYEQFIAKYSANGALLWRATASFYPPRGSEDPNHPGEGFYFKSLRRDHQNNVIAMRHKYFLEEISGGLMVQRSILRVEKYSNLDGSLIAAIDINPPSRQSFSSLAYNNNIATDANGNTYVLASLSTHVDSCGFAANCRSGKKLRLIKLDANFHLEWSVEQASISYTPGTNTAMDIRAQGLEMSLNADPIMSYNVTDSAGNDTFFIKKVNQLFGTAVIWSTTGFVPTEIQAHAYKQFGLKVDSEGFIYRGLSTNDLTLNGWNGEEKTCLVKIRDNVTSLSLVNQTCRTWVNGPLSSQTRQFRSLVLDLDSNENPITYARLTLPSRIYGGFAKIIRNDKLSLSETILFERLYNEAIKESGLENVNWFKLINDNIAMYGGDGRSSLTLYPTTDAICPFSGPYVGRCAAIVRVRF